MDPAEFANAVRATMAPTIAHYESQLAALQRRIEELQSARVQGKPKKPQFFSGTRAKDAPTLREWTNAMEVYIRRGRITVPIEQVEEAGSCLTGPAVLWYNTEYYPNIIPATVTWKGFVDAITARFEPVDAETTARVRLQRLRYNNKKTFSVSKYNIYFNELIGKVGRMMEKDKIEYYLRGLRQEIAEQLRYQMDGTEASLSVYMRKAFNIESALLANISTRRALNFKPAYNHKQHYTYYEPHTVTTEDTSAPMEVSYMPRHTAQSWGLRSSAAGRVLVPP